MADLMFRVKKVEHRQDLPAWDRTVDVVCHQRKHGDDRIRPDDLFCAAMAPSHKSSWKRNKSRGYFGLPPEIRFRICQHVMPDSRHAKPITLARRTFRRDAWTDSDFLLLSEALAPICRYLKVSSAFRCDFLVAFLSSNSFHAVISPYVDHRLSPLTTRWLLKYGPFMQSLILEIDMTKLGSGPGSEAADLSPGLRRMEQLLQRIVESQRRRKTPLSELVLLCRRFYGRRVVHVEGPKEDSTMPTSNSSRTSTASTKSQKHEFRSTSSSLKDGQSPDSYTRPNTSDESWPTFPFYCPDENLLICNHLANLRGRVLALRICGFSESYTHRFVATMFLAGLGRYVYHLAPSGTAWPQLDGQASWITKDDGTIVLSDPCTSDQKTMGVHGRAVPPPPVVHADGSLSLPARAKLAPTNVTRKVTPKPPPKPAQVSETKAGRSTKTKFLFGRYGASTSRKIAV